VVTDPFGHAAHASGGITLTGNAWTDSYNSNNGAYNVGGNRFQRGHISSDSTAGNTIDIQPNSVVNGDAYAGPGANVAAAILNQGTITGISGTESAAWNMPLSTIPAGVANSGALSISGNRTVTLTEGTYWFSSIQVTGNGRLNVAGAVKIYVAGNIHIGGNGVATANAKPPNHQLDGTVDPSNSANKTTQVNIHGNGNFFGAVYAPHAAIQVVGNGNVYGALTGASVTINGNAGLHYDEALGNLGRFVTTATSTTYTTTGFRRYLWREIPF
jgi:cytoskeletal protein CcmA (bactofilin family)